jgi:hypothetical protein
MRAATERTGTDGFDHASKAAGQHSTVHAGRTADSNTQTGRLHHSGRATEPTVHCNE